MKRLAWLGLAPLLLALAACGGPEEGVVKDKMYRGSHTTWTRAYWSPGSCYFRKNGICKVRGPRTYHPPRPVFHRAVAKLYVVSGSSKGWIAVPQTAWASCHKGQYYKKGRCA